MSAFDIIAFPPRPDGKQYVWSLGPSTRDDTRIKQTTPHIEATLTSNELPRAGGAGAAIIGLPATTGEVPPPNNFPRLSGQLAGEGFLSEESE